MSVRIIDEKQIGKTRLLILDGEVPPDIEDEVEIENDLFKRLDLYDFDKALSIVCNESTKSFIGKSVKS